MPAEDPAPTDHQGRGPGLPAGGESGAPSPWLSWVLRAALLLEFGNLFAIAVTNGVLQLPPAGTNRSSSFAGHAALVWLLVALLEAHGMREAGRGYRIARLVVVGLCLWGALLFVRSGLRLSSDGPHYFVQARSFLFDHDVDFTNDYARVRAPAALANQYPVGMAILSLPFLSLAHMLLLFGRWLGCPLNPDGFGYPYETAFGVASYAFGCLALLVMLRATARLFPVRTALVAVVTVWMASFLIWYMAVEPSMPHAMSTAWSALMVSYWLEKRPLTTSRQWALLGAMAGVSALVRWQTGVLLALPLLDGLLESRRSWRKSAWALVSSAACFAPQMMFWWLTAHSALAMPLTQHGVSWSRFSVAEVLFSTNRGLFTWSPVIYLGVAGLVIWARRAPRLALLFLLGFLLQVYVNASVAYWWSGWSFGSRRFDNCLLFFVVGFAAMLEFVSRRPWLPLAALCAFLCVWNVGLMRQSREGRVPPDRPTSFEDVTVRNVQMFYADVGLPFAAPANWYFAWRYGVSPERFDRLFGHEGFSNLHLPFDATSEPFVGRDWSESGADASGRPFRWCVGGSCTLLVPLKVARSYALTVLVRPATGTSPNWVGLTVNGTPQPKRAVADEETLTWQLPPPLWHRGTNELRFDFDRTARPSELGPSSDSRPLAGAMYDMELLAQGAEGGGRADAP
jgi:hypothetical protein